MISGTWRLTLIKKCALGWLGWHWMELGRQTLRRSLFCLILSKHSICPFVFINPFIHSYMHAGCGHFRCNLSWVNHYLYLRTSRFTPSSSAIHMRPIHFFCHSPFIYPLYANNPNQTNQPPQQQHFVCYCEVASDNQKMYYKYLRLWSAFTPFVLPTEASSKGTKRCWGGTKRQW